MPPTCDASHGCRRGPRALLLLIVTIALALAAIGTLVRPISAAPQPTIVVDVDPATAGAQADATYFAGTGEIGVEILALNAPPTGAFEFELFFDSRVLEYRRSTPGSFLGSTGRMPTCIDASTQHTIRFGCATRGPAPPVGPSGDGVLAVVYVHPLLPSHTCLTLLLVETTTVDGEPIANLKQDACMTVGAQPPTATSTRTATATETSTSVPTATETSVPTETSTSSPTATETSVPATATDTPTITPAATETATPRPASNAERAILSKAERVIFRLRGRLCAHFGRTSPSCRALTRVLTSLTRRRG